MSVTPTDICNIAVGKLGGAGEDGDGNAFIASIDGADKTSSWCKLNYPRARRKVISDLAVAGLPFRSTVRFADLGAEPTVQVEIGNWTYKFNVPGNALVVISQFNEDVTQVRRQPADYVSDVANVEYQWEQIANDAGTGTLLLTDTLSNSDQTSAFIDYAIDITNTKAFSEDMIECIATLLASKIAPVAGGDRDMSTELLIEYKQVCIPAAKSANGRAFNNSARPIQNYKGGRTEILRNGRS